MSVLCIPGPYDAVPGGRDHALVWSPEHYDAPGDADGGDPDGIAFCGESFETFLCRYWLENEIWFADNEDAPMTAVGAEYISRYRAPGLGGESD